MLSRLAMARDFSKQFSLDFPSIIQAPMAGGITTPELVAAVSNARGLGMFATGYLSAAQVQEGIQKIKTLTSKPFGANLFIPDQPLNQNPQAIQQYQKALNYFRHKLGLPETDELPPNLPPKDSFHEITEILLAEKISLVSFTFGVLPAEIIARFKKSGVYLMGTATSGEEAKILAEAGVDAVIAQGAEAGGHRGGFLASPKASCVGSMALIPQIAQAVNLPVIASGGIMNGQGILAALVLGASAVQMGTVFLNVHESGAHPLYKENLLKHQKSMSDPTVLTAAYSGKLARGIHTQFVEVMQEAFSSFPAYPIPHYLTSPIRKEAARQGDAELTSMWCGQGLPLIAAEQSVALRLKEIRKEFSEALEELYAART